MKKSLLFVAALLLFVLELDTYAQSPRTRRADQDSGFFVGAMTHFSDWPFGIGDDSPTADSIRGAREYFGSFGSEGRYFDMPDEFGFNFQLRQFWDLKGWGASPPDKVLGGPDESTMDYIALEPWNLFLAFDAAKYIKFQMERHAKKNDSIEYPGFLHDVVPMVGTNAFDNDATTHPYLTGSPCDSDRTFNCLVVDTATDNAGLLDSAFWHPDFIGGDGHDTISYFRDDKLNIKTLMRFRIRIDDPVDTSLHKPLLYITYRQVPKNGSSHLLIRDTIFVDHQFKNVASGFDTYDVRFFRDTGIRKAFFRFDWPDSVSATFDYMEFMTAHVVMGDHLIGVDLDCCPDFNDKEVAFASGEDFMNTANSDSLIAYIDTLVNRYSGHVNYLRIGDEFPLGNGYAFKRLVKLVRERSGGKIEVAPFVQDSISGLYGLGLPNHHVFNFEGARLGWVDTNYADPKFVFVDPYVWNTTVPLPIRTSLTDSADIVNWENSFAPVGGVTPTGRPYSRQGYLDNAQNSVNHLIKVNREGKRMCLRNPDSLGKRGMEYGYVMQAGAGFESNGVYTLYASGLRPPSGPELKVNGHIVVSCGASGLFLYWMSTSMGAFSNGGFMNSATGDYSTMIDTITIGAISNPRWVGHAERADTLKKLIPILKEYGNALFNAEYIGDWKAAELPSLDTSITNHLPFVAGSVRALDDSMKIDNFATDTSNRTLVHISMWRDTVGGRDDTLLYVINMRTDDSYQGRDTVSTIDRRLVTIAMQRGPYLITDVLDTSNTRALDRGIIWTPYVNTGDSLRLLLLPGDGVLVRLDTAPPQPMAQMRVAINYPQGSGDFNDHGRIVFDKPVEGVRDRISDLSVPSTRYSYIGIKDADTVKLWQDSLLYKNVHQQRQGSWRHQNWRELSTPPSTEFKFQKQINPLPPGLTQRNPQVAQDSIAYDVVIKNEFENLTDTFKTRIFDPWFVDGTTLENYDQAGDTLLKQSPFLPHVPPAVGAFDGADPQNYGGVFRKQNVERLPDSLSGSPMYSLSAYNILTRGTPVQEDSVPDYTDWVFIGMGHKRRFLCRRSREMACRHQRISVSG